MESSIRPELEGDIGESVKPPIRQLQLADLAETTRPQLLADIAQGMDIPDAKEEARLCA